MSLFKQFIRLWAVRVCTAAAVFASCLLIPAGASAEGLSSQEPCNLLLRPNFNSAVLGNNFETGRGLRIYNDILPHLPSGQNLIEFLSSLGPDQHIIDASAGSALAVRQYLRLRPHGASVSAYSFRRPGESLVGSTLSRDLAKYAPRFNYRETNWDNESTESFISNGGRLSDVTLDVVGYAQYANSYSMAVSRLAMVTKVGGLIGLGVIETQMPMGQAHRMHSILTILDEVGNEVSIEDYLRYGIDGLEVVASDFRSVNSNESGHVFFLKKTKEKVSAQPLELISPPDPDGAPPVQVFRWRRTRH